MSGLKTDSLDQIDRVMPALAEQFANGKGDMVGPKVLVPFAEAIAALAKEVRQLRKDLDAKSTDGGNF